MAVSQSRKTKIAAELDKARAGEREYRWLNELVLAAGYAPAAGGADDRLLATAHVLGKRLGVSRRSIQAWARDGMPVFEQSLGNRPAWYDVFDVTAWLKEREEAKQALEPADDGLLFEGGGSPHLEAYRKEQARKVRRENDVAEGKLLIAADVALDLREIGRVFREEAEAVERAYGDEIGDAIRAMIERAQEQWETKVEAEGGI